MTQSPLLQTFEFIKKSILQVSVFFPIIGSVGNVKQFVSFAVHWLSIGCHLLPFVMVSWPMFAPSHRDKIKTIMVMISVIP